MKKRFRTDARARRTARRALQRSLPANFPRVPWGEVLCNRARAQRDRAQTVGEHTRATSRVFALRRRPDVVLYRARCFPAIYGTQSPLVVDADVPTPTDPMAWVERRATGPTLAAGERYTFAIDVGFHAQIQNVRVDTTEKWGPLIVDSITVDGLEAMTRPEIQGRIITSTRPVFGRHVVIEVRNDSEASEPYPDLESDEAYPMTPEVTLEARRWGTRLYTYQEVQGAHVAWKAATLDVDPGEIVRLGTMFPNFNAKAAHERLRRGEGPPAEVSTKPTERVTP